MRTDDEIHRPSAKALFALIVLFIFACNDAYTFSSDADVDDLPFDANVTDTDANNPSDADSDYTDSDSTSDADADDDGDAVADEITKVSAIFAYNRIYTHATLNGVRVLMILDTGSPVAVVDRDAAIAVGVFSVSEAPPWGSYELIAVEMGGRQLGAEEIFVDELMLERNLPELPNEPIVGFLGNQLFSNLVMGVDPKGASIWLSSATSQDEEVPAPDGAEEPFFVEADFSSGYVVVSCAFTPATSKSCLFDTGSTDSIVLERYWNELQHPSESMVPTFFGASNGQLFFGSYQRAEFVRMGETGPTVPGEYVLAADFSTFDQWCVSAISDDCVGIVGMHTVWGYHTVFDYENGRVIFFPYQDLSHISPDPFLGFGFLLDYNYERDAVLVVKVVQGSHASAAGVMEGDVLQEIDGVSWQSSLGSYEVWAIPGILAGEPGTIRSFLFSREGEDLLIDVMAEDLLPPLE